MKYSYKTGERVAYNHKFLKAVQAHEFAAMRGTVVTSKILRVGLSLVTVNWDGDQVKKSLSSNLCTATDRINDPTE